MPSRLPAYTGRVAILGDAAHAMTLPLGQALARAIEDAVVLPAWRAWPAPAGLAAYVLTSAGAKDPDGGERPTGPP